MVSFLESQGETPSLPLKTALQIALRTWAVSLMPAQPENGEVINPALSELDRLLKERLSQLTPEVALLDQTIPGTSKYRALSEVEIQSLIREWLH
jgi:hypothetical protein